jgi:hypothetical protein
VDPELVELRVQLVDDGNDVRRPEPRSPPGDHDDAQRRNLLGDDVVGRHGILPGDAAEPGLDSEQMVLVFLQFMLELGTPQDEHAAELAERDPFQ